MSTHARKDANLIQSGLAVFGFLMDEFPFHHVPISDPNVLRFETPDLFAEIRRFSGHSPSAYFLGVELGNLKDTRTNPLDLVDLARHAKPGTTLLDLEREAAFRNFPANTQEQLEDSLGRLAGLFRTYAKDILGGGFEVFDKVMANRHKWIVEDSKKDRLKKVRADAETAFEEKDYSEVVRLYESIRDDLLPSEAKRLEYARKHLGETS